MDWRTTASLVLLLVGQFPAQLLAEQDYFPRQQFSHLHPQRAVINAAPALQPAEPLDLQQTFPQRRNAAQKSAGTSGSLRAAKARGYTTDQRTERSNAAVVIDCGAPAGGQCSDLAGAGHSFNPALSGGMPGSPGIKARLNSRAFQYLSTIAGGILNYFIKRARLPNISQCIPQVQGCINVYNLYVSRYRCPQRVTVYPAPPNQIVLDVQNLDIGVTGNLGGQIVILLPLALFGIVQVNAHQVNVRVAVTIERASNGCPALRLQSCSASVGYVDVFIQNGGLIGDIANSQFRSKISEMVRQQIPSQLCQRLPQILDEELNSKLCSMIPQKIPLSQLLQIAINTLGLGNLLGGMGQCPTSCANRKVVAAAAPKLNGTIVVPESQNAKVVAFVTTARPINNGSGTRTTAGPRPALIKAEGVMGKGTPTTVASGGTVNSGKTLNARLFGRPTVVNGGAPSNGPPLPLITISAHRQRSIIAPLAPHAVRPVSLAALVRRHRLSRATPSESGRLSFVDPGENLCSNCPSTGGDNNPLGFLSVILQSMDLSKLENIYLDVGIMNTYATNNDFTIELKGEFSVCGHGCTPFGAFPMQFPSCVGCKIVEVLISDFTINSLLYHLHNVGFLNVRVGPETPKIGELLKTTCSTDDGDEGELEDHGVETEEGTVLAQKKRRAKRQDAGDLATLGICLGDILPAVRERYPDQQVYIVVSTERAPSVVLSGRNGGVATVDIVVNADFYIASSNQKVGTIRIAAVLDVSIRTNGNHLSAHADITYLDLKDVGNQLGLPQDALDNLGQLGKEIILKAGNDALNRGGGLPQQLNGVAGLPISIVDPEVHFLDHAILLGADFTLNPSALGGSEPC